MRLSLRPFPERGFTLIEVAVVLMIVGIMIAMAAAITRGVTGAQKRSLTATRMATVDAALLQYVTQQRRLPCPADGTLNSTNNNAGIEGATGAAGCTGDQSNGVVPWRALGLTELEITDGWARRLTYRIQPTLATPNILDMSWCDPAGGAAALGVAPSGSCQTNNAICGSTAPATVAGCTTPKNYLASKGLRVQNLAGTVLMEPTADPHTGAAYVLISHGETGGGGYLNSGVLGVSTVTDGTAETTRNYASLPYVSLVATFYVDDSLVEATGAGHFDDILSRPSVMSVITKAGLGPRTH